MNGEEGGSPESIPAGDRYWDVGGNVSRWKAVCAYDGTDYSGWQSQPGKRGVQDFIENRLEEIFKQKVRILGSGRTDAGVHARGQVFHFDAAWRKETELLLHTMRTGFPASIRLLSLRRVMPEFHAQKSATGKIYCYRIYQGYAPPHEARYHLSIGHRVLDLDRMRDAATHLIGMHDFTSFSANRGRPYTNALRYVASIRLLARGRHLAVWVEGNGFMYKMVRSIVGTLIEVGRGELAPDAIPGILLRKERTATVPSAPALGLSLEKVFYTRRPYPKNEPHL